MQAAIAKSDQLSHLKHLLLATRHYNKADFDALLQLPSCLQVHLQACEDVFRATALARASSPQLHMELITAKEVQQLATATWPCLVSLRFWCRQTFRDDPIIHSLAGAQWPAITSLSFGVEVMPSAVQCVSKAMSGHLRMLALSGYELEADHFQALQQGSWPVPEEFTAECACLEEQHLHHLVQCNWPRLKVLNLNETKLATADMEILVSAKWPVLQQLYLLEADIDLKGAEALARGEWPMLQELCLSGQQVAPVLAGLRQARWPLLQRLEYCGD